MSSLPTTSALPILPPVSNARLRGLKNLTRPSRVRMFQKHLNFNSGRMKYQVKCSQRWVPNTHATRTQSTSLICGAAPWVWHVLAFMLAGLLLYRKQYNGLVNPPKLDDGGTGLPPRDDGGGDGGDGGGSSSGGFFLFGFLLILSYIKDLEAERELRIQ